MAERVLHKMDDLLELMEVLRPQRYRVAIYIATSLDRDWVDVVTSQLMPDGVAIVMPTRRIFAEEIMPTRLEDQVWADIEEIADKAIAEATKQAIFGLNG